MAKNKTELGDLINDVMMDLLEYTDDAIRDERDDAYAAGYRQGRFDQRMDTAMDEVKQIVDGDMARKTARDFLGDSRKSSEWADNTNPPTLDELMELGREVTKSPQERRDEIVEQAKEDIDVLKDQTGTVTGRAGYETSSVLCDAEFVVNSEKRTVVCLLKGQIA